MHRLRSIAIAASGLLACPAAAVDPIDPVAIANSVAQQADETLADDDDAKAAARDERKRDRFYAKAALAAVVVPVAIFVERWRRRRQSQPS